jgi:hypothetical protein
LILRGFIMKIAFSKGRSGFRHIALAIVAVAVIGGSGIIGYYAYQAQHTDSYKSTAFKQECSTITVNCGSYSLKTTTKASNTTPQTKPITLANAMINGTSKSNVLPPPVLNPTVIAPSPIADQSTSTSPSPDITTPILLELTNASNGQTVHVTAGQSFVVDLSNVSWSQAPANQTEPSQSTWSDFSSSDTAVLGLVGGTSYSSVPGSASGSSNGSSEQSYQALSPGTSDITAQSSMNDVCGLGTECPQFVLLLPFEVTIIVDPATD